ncbi:DUF72 domain-containing protein [Myxococcota bacterium]|nr:DUF72 domain-containing protein [Myxococcota bacterium]MBU1536896.1 DUF72 domain-containing protein [Myxococcota bacterium]
MCDLRVGTSGYDYLDWIEAFYPEQLSRNEFLPYYSKHFNTLELNFSYYRMPTKEQMVRFAQATTGNMDFSIKAHESLTHRVDPHLWRDHARDYIKGISPLMEQDKLNSILLQFPYSFHYTPENRRYLDQLITAMGRLPLVVEFRSAQWMSNRVFDGLRRREVGLCITDTPRLKGLPPAMDVVTSHTAYIRFHGRNEENWWGSDAAARFDYLYSPKELGSWIARIKTIVSVAQKIRVYFNNHRRGQAPANALMLKELLKKAGVITEGG